MGDGQFATNVGVDKLMHQSVTRNDDYSFVFIQIQRVEVSLAVSPPRCLQYLIAQIGQLHEFDYVLEVSA